MKRSASLLARYGGLLALLALGVLSVLQEQGIVDLDSAEWVQLAIAAATIMLASAAGSLALDGRDHAALLERHIHESAKLAQEAARHADETTQLVRANQTLATETVHLAQVAAEGLDISRGMLEVGVRDVELREQAELLKVTPNGYWRVRQRKPARDFGDEANPTGMRIAVRYRQGEVQVEDMWAQVTASMTDEVHQLTHVAGTQDWIATPQYVTDAPVKMARVRIACRVPGQDWIYREIHVHFGSGASDGTNSSIGEWIRDTPDWSWIQPSSGVPNRALGKL